MAELESRVRSFDIPTAGPMRAIVAGGNILEVNAERTGNRLIVEEWGFGGIPLPRQNTRDGRTDFLIGHPDAFDKGRLISPTAARTRLTISINALRRLTLSAINKYGTVDLSGDPKADLLLLALIAEGSTITGRDVRALPQAVIDTPDCRVNLPDLGLFRDRDKFTPEQAPEPVGIVIGLTMGSR